MNSNTSIQQVSADNPDLKKIRRTVFIDEQKVPEALEWDKHDRTASHFLLYLDGRAIACARLKTDGQIGRMAVLKEHRGHGYGSLILRHVLAAAAGMQLDRLYLHAQTSAIGFYEKHGFVAQGEVFQDAGIEHREMFRNIC